jgi:hypothetical protein
MVVFQLTPPRAAKRATCLSFFLPVRIVTCPSEPKWVEAPAIIASAN